MHSIFSHSMCVRLQSIPLNSIGFDSIKFYLPLKRVWLLCQYGICSILLMRRWFNIKAKFNVYIILNEMNLQLKCQNNKFDILLSYVTYTIIISACLIWHKKPFWNVYWHSMAILHTKFYQVFLFYLKHKRNIFGFVMWDFWWRCIIFFQWRIETLCSQSPSASHVKNCFKFFQLWLFYISSVRLARHLVMNRLEINEW